MTTIDLSGALWRKSSYSGEANGCIEVGNGWRKSRYSGEANSCVEVGQTPARVAVRDTKDRDGGMVAVSPAAWRAFTSAVRQGQAVRNMGRG